MDIKHFFKIGNFIVSLAKGVFYYWLIRTHETIKKVEVIAFLMLHIEEIEPKVSEFSKIQGWPVWNVSTCFEHKEPVAGH